MLSSSQTWWNIPAITALQRLRQDNEESEAIWAIKFQASLGGGGRRGVRKCYHLKPGAVAEAYSPTYSEG
jgi:hypothetical protein